jgi:predicted cation transporter
MCVFCWDFVEGLGAEIDGFNVCVLLELSDSVYAGVVTACVMCVHAKMCVVQRNCRCRNCVGSNELAFAAETVSTATN